MSRPTRVVIVAGGLAAAAAVLSRVGLSRSSSKHIGETEASLDRTFDDAEAQDVVLLVDDADALFGADEDPDDDDPD